MLQGVPQPVGFDGCGRTDSRQVLCSAVSMQSAEPTNDLLTWDWLCLTLQSHNDMVRQVQDCWAAVALVGEQHG